MSEEQYNALVAQIGEIDAKVTEIHEFVESLKQAGESLSRSNSPMAAMIRNFIPGM